MPDGEVRTWRELVAVLGLRRQGCGYRGRCPLHGGGNPTAFVVTPGRGFYCHACGRGGSLHALARLLDPLRPLAVEDAPVLSACVRSVRPLAPVDPTHAALRALGVDATTARVFGCGVYCGPGQFAGRIVFPLHDATGRLVGYLGRTITNAQPRYRLTRGCPRGHLLFNEHRLAARDRVIVVEGPFDALAVYAAGEPAVVATLGCAVTAAQVRRLKAFHRVDILFDADAAGAAAAAHLHAALGAQSRVLTLPAADPANVHRSVLRALIDRW